MSVALGQAGDQLAFEIVESGKQGERAVADIDERNKNAKRYVWRAKGEDILRKIEAARHALAAAYGAEFG